MDDAELKAQVSRALLVDELRLAELRLRERSVAYEAARVARNELVLRALEEGVKQAQIGRITDLSRTRIHQLKRVN